MWLKDLWFYKLKFFLNRIMHCVCLCQHSYKHIAIPNDFWIHWAISAKISRGRVASKPLSSYPFCGNKWLRRGKECINAPHGSAEVEAHPLLNGWLFHWAAAISCDSHETICHLLTAPPSILRHCCSQKKKANFQKQSKAGTRHKAGIFLCSAVVICSADIQRTGPW